MAYNTAALCYAENAIFGQRYVEAIDMHICMRAEEFIAFSLPLANRSIWNAKQAEAKDVIDGVMNMITVYCKFSICFLCKRWLLLKLWKWSFFFLGMLVTVLITDPFVLVRAYCNGVDCNHTVSMQEEELNVIIVIWERQNQMMENGDFQFSWKRLDHPYLNGWFEEKNPEK